MSVTPKRRWYQFSLRGLLVLMLLLSLGLGWLGKTLVRVRTQRNLVRQIEATGGRAEYDYVLADVMNPKPPGPWLIRRLIGDDAFANITYVELDDAPTTLEVLKRLPELPKLDWLYLSSAQITDADVDHLKGLSNLHTLLLSDSRVTSAGIKKLQMLTELKSLSLSGGAIQDETLQGLPMLIGLEHLQVIRTHVTSAGLVPVGKLERLKKLDLYDNQAIGDDCIKHLRGLSRLESLELWPTKDMSLELEYVRSLPQLTELKLFNISVSDDAVEAIGSLRHLKQLDLQGTPIGDKGAKHLLPLSDLKVLQLDWTNVTDVGVSQLTKLSQLEWLSLYHTKVSDEGISQLESLTKLKRLSLGPNLSEEAVGALSRRIPDCRIECIFPSSPSLTFLNGVAIR